MLTTLSVWQQLQDHRKEFDTFSLSEQFTAHPQRATQFSAHIGSLHIDFSKNLIQEKTLQLLIELAEQRQLKKHIDDLFSGNIINYSEQQPALHAALRTQGSMRSEIQQALNKMEALSHKLRQQQWQGYSGKTITDVINLGVGGSYLGPFMTTQALKSRTDSSLRMHFIANQHDAVLHRLLNQLNAETTLVLVSSKSFTTHETMHNFQEIMKWFTQKTSEEAALKQHVIGITAHPERALSVGIAAEHVVPFWSWVGGRYSIWSAIGLPLCIAIGMDGFKQFLAGAAAIDEHFFQRPLAQNVPVLLSLIDIWYIQFFSAHTTAILPYHQDLYLLPRYLQQLAMESIGKSVTQEGSETTYPTGNVFWGGVGSTGQHAYHQLLHQGTEFIPCDFIVTFEDAYLFSQCLAQTRALMVGQKEENPAKTCPGNRPSTTIVLPELTPYSLGALLALYEHRIFSQAMIWNINPFDQWGVEQGKKLGQELKDVVEYRQIPKQYDSSTRSLLEAYYHYCLKGSSR